LLPHQKEFSIINPGLRILRAIKKLAGEIFIIFALLVIINNYFEREKILIKSDGAGYYDYLPALFIYGDLPDAKTGNTVSERINSTGVYVNYKDSLRVNKYPCGTAALLFPFFVYAHLTAPLEHLPNDGFSQAYHDAVFIAAFFYLFFGLVFLRKLLGIYNLHPLAVFFIQCLVVFGTSLMNYTYYDPSFSHVYSFFAITAFLYFAKSWFTAHKSRYFLLACLSLAMVVLLRQLNGVVVLIVPFLAESFPNLKASVFALFKSRMLLLKGIGVFLVVTGLQLYLWHRQTGDWLVDSYQGESFDFSSPAFFDILFSYRKGLFIYTPVMFIMLCGSIIYLVKKQYYLFLTWLSFFLIITYIFSSWWSWYYGSSFGLRAYIDFYAVFCLAFIPVFRMSSNWLKGIVFAIAALSIPVSIIQTWQYKVYILHWSEMNRQKYWDVFLRTAEKFRGVAWKNVYVFDEQHSRKVAEVALGDKNISANSIAEIYADDPLPLILPDSANLLQIKFANAFSFADDTRLELVVSNPDSGEVLFYMNRPLIHFSEQGLGHFHDGEFNFEVPFNDNTRPRKISLKVVTKSLPAELKNVRINYFNYTK
jgi:hypothetical protein